MVSAGGMKKVSNRSSTRSASIAIVGCGGNIGSQLVPFLAKTGIISRIVLCDKDSYEEKNLLSQNISRRDLGKRKVTVQAAVCRRINPSIELMTFDEPIENVPLGCLDVDVLL